MWVFIKIKNEINTLQFKFSNTPILAYNTMMLKLLPVYKTTVHFNPIFATFAPQNPDFDYNEKDTNG